MSGTLWTKINLQILHLFQEIVVVNMSWMFKNKSLACLPILELMKLMFLSIVILHVFHSMLYHLQQQQVTSLYQLEIAMLKVQYMYYQIILVIVRLAGMKTCTRHGMQETLILSCIFLSCAGTHPRRMCHT